MKSTIKTKAPILTEMNDWQGLLVEPDSNNFQWLSGMVGILETQSMMGFTELFYCCVLCIYIRVVPRMAIFGSGHPRTLLQGAYERALPTDFRSVLIFF